MTFDWYTILRIVPNDKLGELLSDPVLDRIRFRDLKEKFLYARQIVLQMDYPADPKVLDKERLQMHDDIFYGQSNSLVD